MIDPKELRIGNWVTGNFPNMVISALNIHHADLHMAEAEEFHELEGIPITPEILVACGFTKYKYPDHSERKIKNMYFITTGYVQVTFVMGETILAGKSESGADAQVILNRSIKYLHQLQNIIFAITGEELIIKPVSFAGSYSAKK